MRHEEDQEEERGGRKGGRKERMMIRIMTSWALGMCCGDGFSSTRKAILVLSWGPLGVLLGRFWDSFGRSGGLLGALLGCLRGLLGPSWTLSLKKTGDLNSCPPLGGSKMPSWGSLGPLLERSWALLGPSWGPLGPLLGLSWAILGPS